MLRAYKKSSGTITSSILIGSIVGVITAASTAISTTAIRQFLINASGFRTRIAESKYAKSGNSKTTPNQNIKPVVKRTYEEGRIWISNARKFNSTGSPVGRMK